VSVAEVELVGSIGSDRVPQVVERFAGKWWTARQTRPTADPLLASA